MLRDKYGDASLIVSAKRCPRCGEPVVQLGEKKPPLPIQIITAVREAELEPEELLEIADALQQVPSDASPREAAKQVPAAGKFITIASRARDGWIPRLTLILTLIALYLASSGSEQAHRDAAQSHRDAQEAIKSAHEDAEKALQESRRGDRQVSTTRSLTDEDIRKIAEQIEGADKQDDSEGPSKKR